MFVYWWYRFVRFREEFEKDSGVDVFAEYYMASNIGRIKVRGDRIRKLIRRIASDRADWIDLRDRLAEKGQLPEDAELPALAAKYRRLVLLLAVIAVGESGLNMFTALIAIPAAGILAGLAGDLVRLAVAIIVTVVGIVVAEIFLQEVLPTARNGQPAGHRLGRRWPNAILWGSVLVGIEWMIFHFGWARVADIEGGHVNLDVAKSIIALSMLVPLIGGGIAWELDGIRSPYQNRRLYDKCVVRLGRATTAIEGLREQENGFFQKETNDYWHTFTRIRSFKEYFNTKKGAVTSPLADATQYARDYERFYSEALKRYSSHKERQDPLAVKLDAANATALGRRVGQDYAASS